MGGELGKYCGNILASDSEDNPLDGINRLDINRGERGLNFTQKINKLYIYPKHIL